MRAIMAAGRGDLPCGGAADLGCIMNALTNALWIEQDRARAAQLARVAAAELARRQTENPIAVRERRATAEQAQADITLWRAITEWTANRSWQASPCRTRWVRTAPACGWAKAVDATDRATRGKAFADAQNEEQQATTARPAFTRWQGLLALASHISWEAQQATTAQPMQAAA